MRNWRETFRKGKMKKLLAGVIAFMLMLNSSAPVWAETDVSASDVTWTLEHTVDDFGDESGNPVIQCIVDGKFSNTATSGSNLKVVVYVIADDMGSIVGKGNYALAFRLLEYGDHVATYTSSEDKILKTKIGDTVEEYKLLGSAPNGDLYVDFIGADLNTKEGLQNYIYDNTKNYGEAIAKQLLDGNDIKCAVLIGSSKYNFTLKAGNIKDVFDEFIEDGEHELPLDIKGHEQKQQEEEERQRLAKQQEALDYVGSLKNMIKLYMTGQTSKDGMYEDFYIKNHYTEWKPLSADEISSEDFTGYFLRYKLGFSGYVGREDGTYYNFDNEGNKRFLGYIHPDGTFQSREEWNPNYEELEQTWKIEDGRLKLTKVVKYEDDEEYQIIGTGFEGYYLLRDCTTNDDEKAPAWLMIKYNEDFTPAFALPEDSANGNEMEEEMR